MDYTQFDTSGGAGGDSKGVLQNGANWSFKYDALNGERLNGKVASTKLISANSQKAEQLATQKHKEKGNFKRIIHNTIRLFKSQILRGLIFKEQKVIEPEKEIFNMRFFLNDEPTDSLPQSVVTHKQSSEVSKVAERKKQIVTKNDKIIPLKKSIKAIIDKPISKKIQLKEKTLEDNSQTSETSLLSSEPFEKCYEVEINESKIPRIQELFGRMRKGSDSTEMDGEASVGKGDRRVGRCNMLWDSTHSSSGGSGKSDESSESDESRQNGENYKSRGRRAPLGEELKETAPLGHKASIFNNLLQSVKPCRSYNMDESHPLYNSLCKNEDSFLSSNWHDRINYAFRNIWALKEYIPDDKSEGEREKEFYNELELFHMSSKIGACGLIYSLFFRKQESENNSISYFKKCFVQVSKESYPHIYKIYRPKFDDDLVFLFDSLVFTVILGSRRNGINYNMARKIYSNDIKGKNVLCDCIFSLKNGSKFSLPVASQIDFMGMRVISEPLMPLSEAYPPVDVIKDIFRGFTFSNYISDGGDNEGANGNKYHLNGKQTMERTPQNKRNNLPNEEKHLKKKKEKMFYERLLLEMENYDHELYQQIMQMSDSMNYHCCIFPFGFSNYYECKVFKKRNNVKIFKSLIDNLFIVRGAEEVLPPYVDNTNGGGDFTKRIRYEFIKDYYQHSLSNTTLAIDIQNYKLKKYKNNVDLLKDASRECVHNIDNYILPKVVNIVSNFSDSFDITQVYHSHGVNMHHLGYLLRTYRDTVPPEFLSEVICREIICRTLKSIYYEHIHSFLLGALGRDKRGRSANIRSGNQHCSDNAYSVFPFINEDNVHHYDLASGSSRQMTNDQWKQGTLEGCNKFICFCEKCFTEWDYFPEFVPHKLLIRLANLTLNVQTVNSLQFWHQVLIPECISKFKINLSDHINIKEIEVYGLLVCMEYHFGVYFNKECKRNYKVRLPLTLEDMSSFGSKKEGVLFPNVAHLRGICDWGGGEATEKEIGESIAEATAEPIGEAPSEISSDQCDDEPSPANPYGYMSEAARSDTRARERGHAYKSPYRASTTVAQNSAHRGYNRSGRGVSGGWKGKPTWEKRTITSNDDDSSALSTNDSTQIGHQNVYSLVDKIRKKKCLSLRRSNRGGEKHKRELTPSATVDNRIRENLQSNRHQCSNFQRSNIALFYPKTNGCFPKYATWSFRTMEKLISSNIMVQEKFKVKNMLKENILNIIHPKQSDFLQMSNICTLGSCNKIKSFINEYNVPCHPYCILNEKMKCINYVRAKKCIYLLLNVSLNKNIFELSKWFLFLAYLHFEHGYVKKCLDVCYYIYGVIPNIGTLRRDILVLILQCKVKEGNIDDALIIYKLIVIFNKFYEGHGNSVQTLVCNVLMASYYYDRANECSGRSSRGRNPSRNDICEKVFCDKGWEDYLGNIPSVECRNHDPDDYQTSEATKKKEYAKNKLLLDQVDHLELKKKYLLKALHYSEESYRVISTTLCDISMHYVCIFALILQGNILMGLQKFQSAIKYYTISLQNCERAKLPNFVTLHNKCLLADSLKNNGNYDKAIEIAEECLKTLSSCTKSSRSLTLYVIFRLAEMKQYIGCRDLIYPNIFLGNISNVHIKKRITTSDFLIFEKSYLNEKNKKYRKESIDLYIKLYDKLRSQKNYNLVFAKDIFGCYYTKDDFLSYQDVKTDMAEEDMEKIFLVIQEILKIKVISLSMKKQFMLASKLLGIVLTKNSSSFVRELTLLRRGAKKGERNGAYEQNLPYGKFPPYECTSTGVHPSVKKREEDHLGSTTHNQNNDQVYITDLLSDVQTNIQQKYPRKTLNFQLDDFHQSRQSNFFHRSCYTREYDYISIEKLLFDDTYFVIEDICKYCYSKCDTYNSKQKVGAETNSTYLLNPSLWFDLLFFSVMKGTCSHNELLILIDLVKFFLTPLQKQLILFHVKSLSNIRGNEQYSEYIQHLLNNEGKEIFRIMNILDGEKNSGNLCVGEHPELSNLHKKDVIKNVDYLSNIIVTNPWLMSPSNTFGSAR
ncbi:hypothetical protein C922_00509 [Plasmodium inui San Antonio 1]|uniref:Clu domain-containing protein n=1 Tax=Plasmodium inui San Antonio 1 TaxID=1237626 RepID=W7ATP9_9APIC|nr:hypothetical protein C922_00509 [Plasmodium inui San Antonio 1]EUD68821.1 hypothetical protein C922_00509 [Plasmodium inui San Antonio 1]